MVRVILHLAADSVGTEVSTGKCRRTRLWKRIQRNRPSYSRSCRCTCTERCWTARQPSPWCRNDIPSAGSCRPAAQPLILNLFLRIERRGIGRDRSERLGTTFPVVQNQSRKQLSRRRSSIRESSSTRRWCWSWSQARNLSGLWLWSRREYSQRLLNATSRGNRTW